MGRGKRGIYKDFYESHGRDFQKRCYEWLNFLYPDLIDAKDLGEIDNEGVDLYILDSDKENYLKAFQCKGFEKSFGESQLKQCIKSIQKFLTSGIKSEEYYLIINTQVNSDYSKKLIEALDSLRKGGVAKLVKLINAKSFIDLFNGEFQKLIIQKAKESNLKFYTDYDNLMGQGFYFEDVPFVSNNVEKERPLKYLSEKAYDSSTISINLINKQKGKYFFLISEFGFGKTTTLLELYKTYVVNGLTPIFIPAGVLDSNAFGATSTIAKEIFKVLFEGEDVIDSEKVVRFSGESMTALLENNSNIILLFDGLDEHLQFFKLEGLKRLFNSTANFKAPCIFSFRQSYWEEHHEDFRLALSKTKADIEYIFLKEWNNEHISKFVTIFESTQSTILTASEIIRIDEFVGIVDNDLYKKYYGDIPKRPLFLKMILRDIIGDKIKAQNISGLYEDYFKEKFERDIQGQFASFEPQREIDSNFSVSYLLQVMLSIHEAAAMACITNDVNFNTRELAIIENIVHEKEIRRLLELNKLGSNLAHFINLSVLTPVSRRGNMNMRLKFVHKSFMEFFIAKGLIQRLFIYAHSQNMFRFLPPECYYDYPNSILDFVKGLTDNIIKEIGRVNFENVIQKILQNVGVGKSGLLDYLVKEYNIHFDITKDDVINSNDLPF